MKRIIASFLAFFIVFSLCPMNIVFADTIETGSCGTNLRWYLLSDGTLNITGTGEMDFYSISSYSPWYHNASLIKKITISHGVTSIDDYAFYTCSEATEITIPDSVTNLGDYSFAYCSSLKSVNLPENLETIGASAFKSCINLENISIPDNVTQIENAAFYECDSLVSISLPNGLEIISDHLFFDCDSLSAIRIPKSISKIGMYSFHYCAYLSDIYYTGTKSEWDATLGTRTWTQTIHYNWSDDWEESKTWQINESGLLTIDTTGPMRDFNSPYLSTQNLPWYKERNNIKKVIINEGVTSIGTHAFHECVNLEEAKIADSVTKINKCAFSHCSNLTSISFSANVTSIGDNAFYNCNNLSDIYFGGTEKEWNKISIGVNNEWLSNVPEMVKTVRLPVFIRF